MHVLALLTEAPKDELALQHVGKAILSYILNAIASGKLEQTPKGFFALPEVKLGAILPKGSWQHLYTVLAQTDIMVMLERKYYGSRQMSFPNHGEYYPGLNALNIYGTIDEDNNLQNQDDILSTIVHELRHRLDDSRSKGNMFRSSKERTEYLKMPSEINARFTQAVADIIDPLRASYNDGHTMSVQEFVKQFEIVAAKYNLMDVFKYDPESATDTFLKFAKDGIFGRQMATKDVHPIAQHMANKPVDQPVGPMDDKAYRRLISRVALVYNAAIQRWDADKKKALN